MKTPEPEKENQLLPLRLWNWLTASSSALTDVGEVRAARLVSSFLLAILVFQIFPIVIRANQSNILDAFTGGLGISLTGTLIAFLISRTRWYRLAIFIFTMAYSSTAYISMINQGDLADISLLALIYAPLGLIVASSFLSWPTVFLLTGLNMGALYATRFFGVPVSNELVIIAGILTTIGVVLMLLSNFRNRTEKLRLEELQNINSELESLSRDLEQRVEKRTAELEERTIQLEESAVQTQRRTVQLEAVADVASSIASIRDLDQLLPYITQTVSERFGFYHVGIFLISEDNEFAVLKAANSVGGQAMLARKHQLRVGHEGVVGFVVAQKSAHIALDVGDDAVYFNNPDLPATRSEMALPLMVGEEIIGVLDVQSEEQNAFSNEDIEVLNTLANQVAVAIENTRLFKQSQDALKELDATFQRYISNEWKQFTTESKIIGYRAHEAGMEPIIGDLSDSTTQNSDIQKQTIPIKLRGTILGALDIDMGKRLEEFTEEEMSLIHTVADRLALALESARLLETSQVAAAKEQTIGEITGKIGASINMRNVLQTAVEELGRAIPGSEILIQFAPNAEREAN